MNRLDRLDAEKDLLHPFQTYPQFIRYLSGHQRKVLDALLMHNGAKGSAFPSNARIAGITGLKKQTIQNVKGELCRLGVLTKKPNKYGGYTYTVITTWRREEFLAEFYRESAEPPSPASELHALKLALVSAEPEESLKIIERIKEMTIKVHGVNPEQPESAPAPEPVQDEPPAPAADTEGLLDFIVRADKPRSPHAYKNKIRQLIKRGEFDGLEEYERRYNEEQMITVINQHGKEVLSVINEGKKIRMDENSAYVQDGRFFVRFAGVPGEISHKILRELLESIPEKRSKGP